MIMIREKRKKIELWKKVFSFMRSEVKKLEMKIRQVVEVLEAQI